MADIIPPRRGEVLTNDGSGTNRFNEYLERITSRTNETFDSVELLDSVNIGVSALSNFKKRIIELEAFTDKYEQVTTITSVDSPYTALSTDGLIKADITGGDITVILPTGADFAGFVFEVKAIADTLPSANDCLIVGESAALIDDDAGGITIDALESVPFKYDFDANKYWINN